MNTHHPLLRPQGLPVLRIALLLLPLSAPAATFYWDSDNNPANNTGLELGTGLGGSGTLTSPPLKTIRTTSGLADAVLTITGGVAVGSGFYNNGNIPNGTTATAVAGTAVTLSQDATGTNTNGLPTSVAIPDNPTHWASLWNGLGTGAADDANLALLADTIDFRGTGGAVTLTNSPFISGIAIRSNGYTFAGTFGSGTLLRASLDDETPAAITATLPSSWAGTGSAKTITVGENDILTIASLINGTSGGTLTKTGPGTFNYTSTGSTFSRSVVVSAGTFNFAAWSALVGGGTNPLTISAGAILNATADVASVASGTATTTLGNAAGIGASAGKTFTINHVTGGGGGLRKVNPGKLLLTHPRAVNTGATSVSAGTLAVTGDVNGKTSGLSTTTVIGNVNAANDTVTLVNHQLTNGEAIHVPSSGSLGGATGPVVNTLYFAGNVTSDTFQFFTDRALTAVVDITADNTSAFTIRRNSTLGLNAADLVLGDAATLAGDTPAFLTEGADAHGIFIRRPITVNDAGAGTTLGGTSDIDTTFTATVTLNKEVQLTSATTGPRLVTFTGDLTGPGGVNKTGPGTVSLTNAKTYLGATTVTSGTLSLTDPSLADGADVKVAAGAVLDLAFTGTDTVNRFLIAGIPQASGTWGSLASTADNKTARLTGPGLLSVTSGSSGGSGFAGWTASFGLTGADAALDFDFDRDGVPNGVEYVLGTSPLTSPGTVPAPSTGPGTFLFSFQRASASLTPDITTVIQTGTALGAWPGSYLVGADTASSTPGVTVTAGASPGFETITLTLPATGSDLRQFARLKVSAVVP